MKLVISTLLGIFIIGTSFPAAAGSLTGKVMVEGNGYSEAIVVYLEEVSGSFRPPKKRPQIDHANQQFAPRTLVVTKGTTVDFPNSDQVFHSAFSISESNPFDLGIYGPGLDKNVEFNNSGVVEIFCHIHEHMYGFVLVLENPYFTTAADNGGFLIRNIPQGTYKVSAWMPPRSRETKSITINGTEKVSMNFTLRMN